MAAAFYPSGPGRVVQFDDPFADGALIPLRMDNPLTFAEHRSIITRVNGQPKVNYQVMHTLGSTVYANVFGDRSSPFTVSGISAARGCEQESRIARQHGIELALKWYNTFKASNNGKLIRFMIGSYGLDTILIGFPFDIADVEAGVVSWTAELLAVPEKR